MRSKRPSHAAVPFAQMEPSREPLGGSARVAALVAGSLTALAGAVIVTLLGSLFSLSAGLLVVAFFVGRFTALAVDAAGGTRVGPAGSVTIAVALGLVGVGLGQVGLWVVALAQGGSLDLATFLGETYGPLVPAELGLAALGAWWRIRR